jgi:DNA primase
MNNAYINEQIKSAVSMWDVLERYGFKVGRNKRIPCPFHGGKDNNLGVKDEIFHCFVCGEKGDIFDFVMKLFNIPFGKAVNKLCEDFSLPYGNCTKMSQNELCELQAKSDEVVRKRKEKELYKKQLEDEYWGLWDALQDLEENLVRYSPRRGDTKIHPLWKVAANNIEGMRYALRCKEAEIEEFERNGVIRSE